jgi:aquaporin Z
MVLERKKIAMVLAEFLGTAILTAVILTVSRSGMGYPYFIALAAGLTIAAGTLVFGVVSGAHFNPIITIGLWTARKVKTLSALVYVAAQLLGGFSAYLLYTYLVDAQWGDTAQYDARILVAEAVGAFIFSMGWAAAVYNKFDSGKAAFTVGASLIIGILAVAVSVGPMIDVRSAGAILNPAVALGLRAWEWGTYVLGPVLGAIIGFNLYALLFAPDKALIESTDAPKNKKK